MQEITYKALDMNSETAQRAMRRCQKLKPFVHVVSLDRGIFTVPSRQGTGEHYVVRLIVTPGPDSKLLFDCTCPGSKNLCVHVAGAALVWRGIVQSRTEADAIAKREQARIEREQSVLIKPRHKEVKVGYMSI